MGETGDDPKSLVVFFATNRRRKAGVTNPPDAFDKDSDPALGAGHLWLGKAVVKRVGDPLLTEAPRGVMAFPEIDGDDDFADPDIGSAAGLLDAWLTDALNRQAVALLFVHGFANGFGSALERAGQITEFYAGEGVNLAPLVFTWPSDGKVFSFGAMTAKAFTLTKQYHDDQRDATAAGPALARLLVQVDRARRRAAKNGMVPRMALLAHSMGNLALSAGLAELDAAGRLGAMAGLFEDAVLAASDVPNTVLGPGGALRGVAQLASRVTVAINVDAILDIASETANPGTRRLGHWGPADLAALPRNVTVVDCFPGLEGQQAKDQLLSWGGTSWDIIGHQYYRNDRNVREMVAVLLSGGAPALVSPLPLAQQVAFHRARHAQLLQRFF